ncbi:MAG: energy transducer TonB [Terriglobales bacterium]|jgi:protein TonB
MESPGKDLLRLLVERAPAGVKFDDEVAVALAQPAYAAVLPEDDQSDLWRDVFVRQELPWRRFLQSALLHAASVVLIWTASVAWIRQQRILDRAAFDRSSLVTYTPDEYLPPLDTGQAEPQIKQKGDPAYAKQAILSVPREVDNRRQTIVVPPDLKLDRDVALPNIVASGAITPAIPLEATRASLSRVVTPDTQVIAPPPEVQLARDRVDQAGMKSDIIAPPPEVTSTKGRAGLVTVEPSQVVGPAPQLTLAEQHALPARGSGNLPGDGVQPVGPPPSVPMTGRGGTSGRLVALGIHPVTPSGPVAVPGGNRRGNFAATPQGKPGGAGTPDLTGSKAGTPSAGGHGGSGSLPAGLHVDAANAGADDPRDVASVSAKDVAPRPTRSKARVASPVSDDKITDLDRQVFGGRRPYTTPLNMPNLNSSSGSWEIRFAELDAGRKEGELVAPLATEQSDPGYPLELIRANVHGMVTLYAVIHSDGRVGEIRVLNSPDERLDPYAEKALARWRFAPAERAGKPVAIEALVKIPFRVRKAF